MTSPGAFSELKEKAMPTLRSLRRSERVSHSLGEESVAVELPRDSVWLQVKKQRLVQVQDLLHEFVGGEGHGLRGDTADVVERKASIQSLLDPVLPVHVLQGLAQ